MTKIIEYNHIGLESALVSCSVDFPQQRVFTAVRTGFLTRHVFLRSGVLTKRSEPCVKRFLLTTSKMINGMRNQTCSTSLKKKEGPKQSI